MVFFGPPKIEMHHIGDQTKMLDVVKWMIRKEKDFGSILLHPVAVYLYDNHLHPRSGEETDPEENFGPIPHFQTWVMLKSLIFHDKYLKDSNIAKWNEAIELFIEFDREAKQNLEGSCEKHKITPQDLINTNPYSFDTQHIHAINYYAI